MKRSSLTLILVVSACPAWADSNTAEGADGHHTHPMDHQRDYIVNWTCEEMASDYRADRKAKPVLCEGYDKDGWPIEGAKVDLPKDFYDTPK